MSLTLMPQIAQCQLRRGATRSCRAGAHGRSAAIAAALSALLLAPAFAEQRLIRATGFVAPDGAIQTDARILVDAGLIKQLGGELSADITTDDYGTAVICPGLIDVHSALGALGQLGETQTAMQPDARAADAFDAHHAQIAAALRAGVTTFALIPDDRNVIGGSAALVRCSGPENRPGLWDVTGPLRLSLSPAVFNVDREPTSRSGAIGMLRDALATPPREPADSVFAEFAAGRRAGLLAAPTGADVFAALALAEEHKLQLIFEHQDDARSVAAQIAKLGARVVVGPYDFSTPPRQTQAAGLFERAGVQVAIAGNLPAAPLDSLRVGAAVAARDGLSPAAARRAITATPAEFLGVGERVGSIAPGRAADLVVFSGDPLDLRSRVLAVYVAGVRVYRAAPE